MYTNIHNKLLDKKIHLNSKLGRDVIYGNLNKIINLYGGNKFEEVEQNNIFTEIIREASKNIKLDFETSDMFIKVNELGSPGSDS